MQLLKYTEVYLTTEESKLNSSKKQLAINLISNVIAFLINLIINFFLSPFIIARVGSEAYGFVSLANNFVTYASLLTIAINSMSARFITIKIHQNDMVQANKYFNSVLIANSIVSVVLIFPATICVAYLEKILNVPNSIILEVKVLFSLIFANFILSVIGSTFSVATFATNNLYKASLRDIVSNIIKLIILLILYIFFKTTVVYLGVATVVVSIYVLITNVKFTKKLLPDIMISKAYFEIKSIVEIIKSGAWNVLNQLANIFSTGMDLLICNLFIGATAMGTLSIAKMIPILILQMFGIISNVFTPKFMQSYAQEDFEGLKNNISSAIKVHSFFCNIPIVILFVCGEYFYKLWLPTQDAKLLWILSIVCSVDLIFDGPIECLWNIFVTTNKVKIPYLFLSAGSVISIIIVLCSMYFVDSSLVKLIIIAGVSTVFNIIRNTIFLPIYSAKCLNYKWNYFYKSIIKSVISFLVLLMLSVVIVYTIKIFSWGTLIINGFAIVLVGSLINCYFILNTADRRKIKFYLKSKILKIQK